MNYTKYINTIFQAADTDGDGKVTLDDFRFMIDIVKAGTLSLEIC